MTHSRIKNLFAPFFPTEDGKPSAAVAYALPLADWAKAHLTIRALAIHHNTPYSFASSIAASFVMPDNEHQSKLAEQAIETLRNELKSSGRAHDMAVSQQTCSALTELVGFQGRLHDLTVIDNAPEFLQPGRALVEELLFHTGRPIIVVPADGASFSAKRIVIAWDGSAHAARALNDALPFLAQADYVEIACVVDEKDLSRLVPGAEVAPQLARHGVAVTISDLKAIDGDAGKALRARARDVTADLLVMGAYVHSRWRQLVFGGVTNSMLHHTEIPILMSH